MSLISQYFHSALQFWQQSRDQALHWHLGRQTDLAQLKQAQALTEQTLAAQLRKQAEQLAHELTIMKTKNSTELAMVKIQCQQDLKDYQQYIQSLDKLKDALRQNYTHLPEAVAYTIHHHAKHLLNQMWDAQDQDQKLKFEIQLLQFMSAVHEDNQAILQGRSRNPTTKILGKDRC